MTISQSPSKPETLQSMNRNSNQTQPQGPMELFAVMKDGLIFEWRRKMCTFYSATTHCRLHTD